MLPAGPSVVRFRPAVDLFDDLDAVLQLTEHFIGKYCSLLHKAPASYDASFLDALLRYTWPGNVRELQNAIEYAINVLSDAESVLSRKHLPGYLFEHSKGVGKTAPVSSKEYELQTIHAMLQEYGASTESKKRIAQELGISVSTLYRLLKTGKKSRCVRFK